MVYTNTHCHLFTSKYLPDRIMGLPFVVNYLRSTKNRAEISRFLRMLDPFHKNDFFDRLENYFIAGAHNHQSGVFEDLLREGQYGEDWRFCVLSMDFEHMGAGRCYGGAGFLDQCAGLSRLAKKHQGRILPFVCADPRRENLLAVVRDAIEEWGFAGIKIYPPLGYLPDDKRLFPIYRYAIEHDIPVIAHAAPAAPMAHSRDRAAVTKLVKEFFPAALKKAYSTRERCSCLAHPLNYKRLLDRDEFSSLRLCLAHFGGKEGWDEARAGKSGDIWDFSLINTGNPLADNWLRSVLSLLSSGKYPNLYTDIAATLQNQHYVALLETLLDDERVGGRILFGSDFYMNEVESTELWFSKGLRGCLSAEAFAQLSQTNMQAFLRC